MIKSMKNMNQYIIDRIKKRNVTLMFKEINEQRGLLIDDIHVFHKYDKSCFKSIIEFIREKKYYNNKIILTCDTNFLKNKDIIKCKLTNHKIDHSYSEYYKLCLRIIKLRKIKVSSDACDQKIYDSNRNLNIFLSECENKDKIIKDSYDGVEEITKKLFDKRYNTRDIFTLCEGDEKIILLNMIENINNNYLKIYNFISFFNVSKIFIQDYELLNVPITMINHNINYDKNNIIYNRYISKNMISHKNNKHDTINYYLIYLIDTYHKTKDKNYHDILSNNDKKVIDYHNAIYENFQ